MNAELDDQLAELEREMMHPPPKPLWATVAHKSKAKAAAVAKVSSSSSSLLPLQAKAPSRVKAISAPVSKAEGAVCEPISKSRPTESQRARAKAKLQATATGRSATSASTALSSPPRELDLSPPPGRWTELHSAPPSKSPALAADGLEHKTTDRCPPPPPPPKRTKTEDVARPREEVMPDRQRRRPPRGGVRHNWETAKKAAQRLGADALADFLQTYRRPCTKDEDEEFKRTYHW